MTAGHLNTNRSLSSKLSQTAGDPDNGQAPVFTRTEPLSTIQKQDIAATGTFSVPGDSLMQQGSQQFLLEAREGLSQERPSSSSVTARRLCGEAAPQQQQLQLFPSDEVSQLEEAVRHLKAKGFCNLPIQSDSPMVNQQQQQQQHIQHQQQIQKQQIQQQQQLQQQQVLENLKQQLFQSHVQMQCGMFQDAPQAKNAEQQTVSQGVVSNQGSLFQQAQQQQQQQQQQAALFQQASDILSIQTNYLQQTPSHPSPPIFHNPTSLSETRDPQSLFQKASQEQVQAALFQNTMTVLQSPDQQPSTPGLFLPQTSLPSQLTSSSSSPQQQQLAFLSNLQPTPEQRPVFQAQTQLSPIQQRSPIEQQQQQPPQPQLHPQPGQQGPLFQNISPHPSANTLSPGQQPQQQQGLLFCSNPLPTPDPTSSLMFGSQGQMPPLTSSSLVPQETPNTSLLFSQANMVTVNQQDRSEPMALGNPTDPRQQVMYQEQQPMQLGSSSNNQQEPPVGLFMPQSNMSSLQGGLAAQELAQSHMFASQNGVASLQTTTSSPVQQPGSLFQTAVSGSISQPSQPQQSGLFLFGIQNGEGLII